jgi:hypothetical protein
VHAAGLEKRGLHGKRELGECRGQSHRRCGVGGEFVVAAAEVCTSTWPAADARRPKLFQPAPWSQPRHAKQGAGRGYTGVNGLNALRATICTPLSAPVIAATRLRKGSTNSVRGAAKLLADALACARAAGAGGLVIVRADSAYYCYDIIAAARRAGARFSVTTRHTPTVSRAIAGIGEQAWTPIHYPNASSTTTDSGGSPTPRSPKSPSPRSPAGGGPSRSPPG